MQTHRIGINETEATPRANYPPPCTSVDPSWRIEVWNFGRARAFAPHARDPCITPLGRAKAAPLAAKPFIWNQIIELCTIVCILDA